MGNVRVSSPSQQDLNPVQIPTYQYRLRKQSVVDVIEANFERLYI